MDHYDLPENKAKQGLMQVKRGTGGDGTVPAFGFAWYCFLKQLKSPYFVAYP